MGWMYFFKIRGWKISGVKLMHRVFTSQVVVRELWSWCLWSSSSLSLLSRNLSPLMQYSSSPSEIQVICSSLCQWNGMESDAAWLKFCVYMAMGNSSERNLLSSWSSSFVEITNSIPAWLHFGNDMLINRFSFLCNTDIAFMIFYSIKQMKRIVNEKTLVQIW